MPIVIIQDTSNAVKYASEGESVLRMKTKLFETLIRFNVKYIKEKTSLLSKGYQVYDTPFMM